MKGKKFEIENKLK